MWSWLKQALEALQAWFGDAFQWIRDALIGSVLDTGAWFLEQVPVPDSLALASSAWASAANAAGFWLAPWHVGEGLTLLFASLGARFLLRRIPFTGF